MVYEWHRRLEKIGLVGQQGRLASLANNNVAMFPHGALAKQLVA